ncbi:MAG TPA: hypothetical protein DD414_06840 [Lachnospiraceae bacterium]|nr:hypothetical protein [Lachnospiraceae bacterium]
MNTKANKNYRILCIFVRLQQGECIRIWKEAEWFQVSKKSIQRDISDIRTFLADQLVEGKDYGQVVYDPSEGGYRMVKKTDREEA